ncbi:MAG: DUF1799 domain-containing protein [Rhodocyclaceae bacterium]|nr:DUF1799 domain-containing protein [Rhodocyclaceae bacterium]
MAFGADPEAARCFAEGDEAGPVKDYAILPRNFEAMRVFAGAWRRWTFNPMTGERIAMDAAQTESTMRLMGIPPERWPAVWDLLLQCEQEALRGKA